MASNLIDMFNNTVGDIITKQASSILGESAESTSSAVNAIVPSLLATLIEKGSTDAGVRSLKEFMAANQADGSMLTNVNGLLSGGESTQGLLTNGAGILKYLLGDKLAAVVDAISGSSRLKTSSSSSLLKLVAPMLLGVVGKYVKEKSLDDQGLKDLLLGQRSIVKQSLPTGMEQILGLGSLLDGGQGISTPQPTSYTSSSTSTSAQTGTPLSKLLPWIVLLLAALGLFYFIQKGCNGTSTDNDTDTTTPDSMISAPMEHKNPSPPAVNESGKMTYDLPDGKKLDLTPGSFSNKLIDFVSVPGMGSGVGARLPHCFPLQKVKFTPGTATLTTDGDEELNEVVEIMKAYPKVILSIEGHTDNSGDPEKNKVYSEQKAQAVKTWLENKGISSDRLIASGWGDRMPYAENATPEGREINKRVEICVSAK